MTTSRFTDVCARAAPFFGFIGAASALVFACALLLLASPVAEYMPVWVVLL